MQERKRLEQSIANDDRVRGMTDDIDTLVELAREGENVHGDIERELKTYGMACAEHLPSWFKNSLAKQSSCRKAKNEILEMPGIYRLIRGTSDAHLQRLDDLERRLLANDASA